MGRVLTNNVSLAYAIEASLGVLPGSPEWHLLEPNDITAYGANISTTARDPISANRQRRKGAVTDLDSTVEFEADVIVDHFRDFAEGFVFANFIGTVFNVQSISATAYTVLSGGALAAGALVFADGMGISTNDGLKVVDAGSTATDIEIVGGLAVEASPPANNLLSVAGVRSAAGDLDVDASGNITSTVLDFTTLGLTPGQFVHVGGQAAINRFLTADNFGYARIVSIAANLLTLDKTTQPFVLEVNAAQEVDLLFGRFLRNVPVGDPDFLEQSFQFEATWPNLDEPGPGDEYEYALGNFANEMTFQLPLADKATISFGFIGTDTQPPTDTQVPSAATPIQPLETAPFGTASDIARLRLTQLDESGLGSCFKSLNLTLRNNVSPEKCLGTLGALFMNTGNFEVDFEAQMLFTNSAIISAIRNNETLTLDFILENADGAIAFDIPALTLGGGTRELPRNESVLVNSTGEAFQDPTLNTSIGISLFPFVPTA